MFRTAPLVRLFPLAVFGILACTDTPVEPETEAALLSPSLSKNVAMTESTTGVPLVVLGPGQAVAINDRGEVAFIHQGGLAIWRRGTLERVAPGFSPEAINNRRQIVGGGSVWERGKFVDLGTLGGRSASAYDINDRGQIVGVSRNAEGYRRAFLWERGEMRDLGTLGGTQSWAFGINNRGQVVGVAFTEDGVEHAFLWHRGIMQNLGVVEWRDPDSRAEAVNNRGQVVGVCYPSSQAPHQHACLWSRGEVVDLGTLGGDVSYAHDINDGGVVVGISWPASSTHYRAFLWKRGRMTDLGTLGGCCSHALGVNNRGEVVGYALDASNQIHVVVWRP